LKSQSTQPKQGGWILFPTPRSQLDNSKRRPTENEDKPDLSGQDKSWLVKEKKKIED
jgi:hypothetical protein